MQVFTKFNAHVQCHVGLRPSGMVRRCEFVPMDTRENGKLWTKFLVEDKGTRTRGVASSTNASCTNPQETVRQFPSTCQLSPAEDTRIVRLPRDSVLSKDHSYTRRGARVDLCIKCGQHLSGSDETARASSNPYPIPSSVCSRLLGMRDQLFFRASDAGDAHLRELVSLQAELILGQQEELLQRKGELDLLTQEKAQVSQSPPHSCDSILAAPAVNMLRNAVLCVCVCACWCRVWCGSPSTASVMLLCIYFHQLYI